MKIKRLEILGFKSFPDKTVIEFKDGITGVVGPNGCGKSNIVDAIRWVMGEMSAKHLRGKAMEDVIFSGTQNRPSTGMAEVTMVLGNEDGRAPVAYANFSEISVTRRLFRSGESEYSINKTQCRLRDVYDVFLGSGVGTKAYSIIEQGRIGQIVTAKPEERRTIIEEAAGISKFKSRKEAALRKMEATQGNLLRLSDVLGELKRQINSLDRQARKAERYREIDVELRGLELHLGSHDFLEVSGHLKQQEDSLQGMQEGEASFAAEVQQLENQIEGERLDLSDKEREFMNLQEILYEKNNSIQLHQASVDYKAREIESLGKQNEAVTKEMETLKSRLSTVEAALTQGNDAQLAADLEVATAEETYLRLETQLADGAVQEKEAAEQIERRGEEILVLLQTLSEQATLKEGLGRRKVDLKGRIGKDQAEIDEIDRILSSQQSKFGRVQTELSDVKQFKLDLSKQGETLHESIQQHRHELKQAELQLEEIKGQYSLKNSKLASLEELEKNFDGYKEGVKNVMLKRSHMDAQSHIYGTVADIVETESTYETAVGAVLGEKLQYVVVNSQAAGIEALQYLKTESTGRLSCIPLEVREEEDVEGFPYTSEPGVIGPLKNFVTLKGDYRQVEQYLFGDIYLVEDLRRALDLWSSNGHRKTLVTLDGEVVDPSGVVSGGSKEGSDQGILEQKRKIKDLRHECAQLQFKLREQESTVEGLRSRLGMLEQSLDALKRDSHSEELKIVHQEQDLLHLQNEIRRLSERRDKLSLEISAALQEESDIVREIESLEVQSLELEERRAQLQAAQEQGKIQSAEIRVSLESARQQLLEQRATLTQVREKKLGLERELQRALEQKSETQAQLEDKRQSISLANAQTLQLKNEIQSSREALERLVLEVQEKEARTAQLKEAIGLLQNSVQANEVQVRQSRGKLEEVRQQLNQCIMTLSEGRTRLQVLRQQILERYHVDLGEIAAQYADQPLDRESQAVKARELREKLEKIGAVNLSAIEEYQELQTRHDFLDKQYQDLQQSLDTLHRALQKVNRTTKKRFQETFDRVNALFQEVFPKLFRGGRGELILTDPENVLESGVEIVAQPPGKKLQSVSLMSGGEKALAAVSLIFSIFIIKPSPFCLLDEVDAPLDDANIDRFNEMVRSLTDRSQFILITHNKRTMEMADTLYGITMEQPGASKVVSVQLQ